MNEFLAPSSIQEDVEGFTGNDAPPSLAEIAFIRCVERLEDLIDAETQVLRSCARIDFEALNLRKTHALLEFTRVARNLPPRASGLAQQRLNRLVEKLGSNTEALQLHLHAMQEITCLIVESIRSDESDGTYSRKAAPRR